MRALIAMLMVAAGLGWAGSASAQSTLEGRVDRLEHEMNAVQRKIFPGGTGQYFAPEIKPPETTQTGPGTPASDPAIALESRVNALEKQTSTLTNEVETTQNRVQKLEDAFAAYKAKTDARLKALESGATTIGGSGGSIGEGDDTAGAAAASSAKSASPAATNASAKPAASGARADKLAAIEKPKTDDPADDAYIYGYRLWSAGLYPEAETQLKSVVKTYPNDRRASFAQNLLGRSYLDEGKPSLASIAFYDNYKKMPNGERAPDSLFYLAKALMELKKPADACKVYSELTDVYGDKISDDMKAKIEEGRKTAGCK